MRTLINEGCSRPIEIRTVDDETVTIMLAPAGNEGRTGVTLNPKAYRDVLAALKAHAPHLNERRPK